MKFYYGYDNDHYINVTDKVFEKFLFDLGISIPSGDENRAAVFGDPYPGFLKHILVVDAFGIMHRFHHTKEIAIQISSISKQLTLINSPREWYSNVGKNITNEEDRLQQLHKYIECNYGHMRDEYPEQLLAMKFIKPDNKVLEIGGNIGRNTLIMGCILNNPKNMVTLESDPDNAKMLQENLKTNNIDSYVEPSALSQARLIQKGWITVPISDNNISEGWKEVSTITFNDLTKKYNITFDTLVADCEGALFNILKDDPSILDNIQTVILENDFLDIAEKEFVNQIFEMKGLKCIYAESGGWGPCYNFFYEVCKKD
jgi:FkbM family methyltransferase